MSFANFIYSILCKYLKWSLLCWLLRKNIKIKVSTPDEITLATVFPHTEVQRRKGSLEKLTQYLVQST